MKRQSTHTTPNDKEPLLPAWEEEELPERFQLIEPLGSGSFGEVFRVYDREPGIEVALKRLTLQHPKQQLLFRNEFRAMQGVTHPNLVTLYEFFHREEHIFYTMELVEGIPFDQFVQPSHHTTDGSDIALLEQQSHHSPGLERTLTVDLDESELMMSSAPQSPYTHNTLTSSSQQPTATQQQPPTKEERPAPTYHPKRLQRAIEQLALGVTALHNAQLCHRDLKPANVLLTPEGTLKIVDFGLVHQLHNGGFATSYQAGTPAFMPPPGEAPGEAGDWYSVGVMLYQALTGQMPFTGTTTEIMTQKRHKLPPHPSAWVKELPRALETLCMGLLQIDPHKRLKGPQVLDQLNLSPTQPRAAEKIFIGRRRELENLARIAEDTVFAQRKTPHQPRPCTCLSITGPSGIGKTTLANQFVQQLKETYGRQLVPFSVRCYEQESIPYRTLTGWFDQCSHYLQGLSITEQRSMLPIRCDELLRLFPVFGHVRAIDQMTQSQPQPLQVQELRRRALQSFREMLSALCMRKRVVLFLDDLQWLDEESAIFMTLLLKPPQPPGLLLLLSYREEDAAHNEHLQMLLRELKAYAPTISMATIAPDALGSEDAQRLVQRMLPSEQQPDEAQLDRLLKDAAGSPLLLSIFANYIGRSGQSSHPTYTLHAALEAQLAELHPVSRQLLALLAVAKQPLALRLIRQLMNDETRWFQDLPELRSGFVRVLSDRQERAFGLYHSQLRHFLLDSLTEEERCQHHMALGEALEALQEPDPERKAYHYHKAGAHEKAQQFLLDAADKAQQTMAYAHVARLLELSLSWKEPPPNQKLQRLQQLGEAHALNGYGRKAASAYLEALALATTQKDGLALRRLAAEQLLCSGDIDRALSLFRGIFETLQLAFPTDAKAAERGIAWHRICLWTQRYRLPTPTPQRRAKADACYALSLIFGHIDPVRAMYFQTLFLRHAHHAAEADHKALAMMIEGVYRYVQSPEHSKRSQAAIGQIEEGLDVAKRADLPRVEATGKAILGFVAFMRGQWHQAYRHFDECEAFVREQEIHVWEKSAAYVYKMNALAFIGDYARIAKTLPQYIEEARVRGDLFTATFLRWGVQSRMMLALDRPDDALDAIESAAQHWSHQTFDLQRYIELLVHIERFLYIGDAQQAHETWKRGAPSLDALRLQHSPFHQIELHSLRGRIGLARLSNTRVTEPERTEIAQRIHDSALRIEQLHTWGHGLAWLLRAGLAAQQGHQQQAIDALISAETRLQSAELCMHAATARLAWSFLLPQNNRAKQHRQHALEQLATLGIKAPLRIIKMLIPGITTPMAPPTTPTNVA